MALMGVAMRRGVRIDRHAADGIERGVGGRPAVCDVVMMAVSGVLMHRFRHLCLPPSRLK
jgi:hypothetical protein